MTPKLKDKRIQLFHLVEAEVVEVEEAVKGEYEEKSVFDYSSIHLKRVKSAVCQCRDMWDMRLQSVGCQSSYLDLREKGDFV